MFPLMMRGRCVPATTDFDRVFEGFFPRVFRDAAPSFYPEVDIVEGEKELQLRLDLPGLEKDAIRVTVERDVLTISGERKIETTEDGKGFTRFERSQGSFQRSFRLPDWAKTDEVKADYVAGVLEIVIPKSEKATPKEVSISVS